MSDIIIRRKHGKTPADARVSAERMVSELKEKFDLTYAWDGDLLRFKRPGVSGELALDDEEIALSIQLGGFFSAFKPAIENKVHKFFAENFGS